MFPSAIRDGETTGVYNFLSVFMGDGNCRVYDAKVSISFVCRTLRQAQGCSCAYNVRSLGDTGSSPV
jgi:hypothetical protein